MRARLNFSTFGPGGVGSGVNFVTFGGNLPVGNRDTDRVMTRCSFRNRHAHCISPRLLPRRAAAQRSDIRFRTVGQREFSGFPDRLDPMTLSAKRLPYSRGLSSTPLVRRVQMACAGTRKHFHD